MKFEICVKIQDEDRKKGGRNDKRQRTYLRIQFHSEGSIHPKV